MTILIGGMQRHGMNRAAFGTPLVCHALVNKNGKPEICGAQNWRFVETVSQFRIRYQCKTCGCTAIYDFSNNPGHPYEAYGKGKFRQIVDNWKQGHASRGR
jgi:hypothetical protein